MIGTLIAVCIMFAFFMILMVGLYVFWVVILEDMEGDKNVESGMRREQDDAD